MDYGPLVFEVWLTVHTRKERVTKWGEGSCWRDRVWLPPGEGGGGSEDCRGAPVKVLLQGVRDGGTVNGDRWVGLSDK